MDVSGALVQLVAVVGIIAVVVLTVEIILYGLFTYHNHKSFLYLVGILGVVGGFLAHRIMSTEETQITHLAQTVGVWVGAALLVGVFFKYVVKGRLRFPMLMMAPAFLSIAVLVIYPFFFEFRIALSRLNMYTVNHWINTGELGWAGLDNFYNVFVSSPLQTATFWQLLLRTLMWTGINVVFHVFFGLLLAMLLNRKIRFKGIYRTILVIPWAMPQVVAVLAWRGEFHPRFGFINQFFRMLSLPEVNWWSDPIPVFISCCIVNIWLGIPFMMIVFLGGLQSISRSYYEAASIDGASKWQQFRQITLPMLKPVVVPSITLGTIWTFNNVNVIYLMTGQDGGNEYADILVTALYKSAFTYSRFSFSAAFALVICAILLIVTLGWIKISRAQEGAV